MTGSKVPAVILALVGLFELGLAALFGVLPRILPVPLPGFGITGLILAVTGVGLILWGALWWRSAANVQRIKATGIPGQALILGLSQTGMYINNQPQVELQLQVTTAMHAPYTISHKTVVPLIMLGRLTSGQPLAVKVDPANPQSLAILWEAALQAPALGGQPFGAPAFGAQALAPPPPSASALAAERSRLQASGVPGTMTILASTPTGLFDAEGLAVYDLQVQIEVPGQQTLTGPSRVGVPREHERHFRLGMRLPVKADPAQAGRIAVDWQQLR